MKKVTWSNIFLLTALLLLAAWSEGKGQLLVENFDYPATPADSLVMHGWAPHSARNINPIMVTTPGLSYTDYVGSGIGNAVTLVNTGEDVHKTFTAQTVGNTYAAFMVKVTAATTTGDYFLHFGPNTIGTTFRGKVFVKKDASNKLAFGVSVSANSPTASYSGYSYDLDSTYLLVVKYSIVSGATNDLAYLFVNPAISSTEPAATVNATDTGTDPSDIGAIALRQGASANAPNLVIDGLRVTTSWSSALGFVVNDPPSVNSVTALTANTVRVVFNEPVDTSAENTAHYTGIPAIGSAVRSAGLDTVMLNLSSPLILGRSHTLTISSIRDTAGAAMTTPSNHDVLFNNTTGNLVINEMMYNNPGVDSLEFIEFYNADNVSIPLGGLQFTAGLMGTLPDTIIEPGEYFVIAGSHVGFNSIFGFTPIRWMQGQNLNNTGELIELKNTLGDVVDSVRYKDVYPWPTGPAGQGYSLSLMDPLLDNSNGLNWRSSGTRQQPFLGAAIWATPGQMNFVTIPALIEPADGIYFVTSHESGDNMTFRWNESIVPVGGSVYYVVELVDAVNNAFNTIYEGTDTTFDYSLANFDDWLASNNWPVNDTAYGITWRVTANDSVNEFISDGFEMFPIRVNLAPSAFNLLEPADGFRWEVGMSSTDSITWKWSRSVDPEGMPVYYSIEYDTTADMNSAFHGYYYIGTDTFYVDYASMEAGYLNTLGVDSLTMYWRIVATDSVNDFVTSNQLWSIKYVLIPETTTKFSADLAGYQEVPPTPSTATGTGYFELNADSTELFYRIYANGLVSIAPSYIHNAAAGSNGTGVYPLSFTGDSAVGTWTIPSDMVTELFNGNLYVNVQSAAYPSGEIRGQIRMGTAPVALNPARELNAIEFEESIELDWDQPLFTGKEKTYRFSDKQFSRAKKENRVIKTGIAGKETAGLNSYNIYRSTDGVTFSYYDNTDLLYYMDSTVSAGTTYWYFVSAVYTEGQAPPTDTVEATPSVGYSFVEGFNDTSMTLSGELPEGWTKIDADGGDEDPFWGEWRVMPDLDEWFTTFEGDGMMFINYESANPNGLIDEWLISPRLITSQSSMVRLSFMARASGDDWPDSMQVLVSTTTASPDQFTPVDYFLVTGDWEMYDYDLMLNGVMPGDTFYVAFRYLIYDGGSFGNNSDMLMVDYVRIDGMPMTIGVDEPIAGAPKSFALFQNYPNPFNPSTVIGYQLPVNNKVTLKIYNTLGQEVRTLVNTEQTAGQYTIQWDGKNNTGLAVSSGVYIYRIQAGDFVKSKKMMFIK